MTTEDHAEAFRLLREVVSEYAQRGLRPNAAGLKPGLQVRSFGKFNESSLGYKSFREFLFAARAAGHVELKPSGNDYAVLPPDDASSGSDAVTTTLATEPFRQPNRPSRAGIRPDLWRAFLDWTPQVRRYYSRTADTVVTFSELPGGLELPEQARAREHVQANAAEYVEVAPLSRDQMLEWMKEFAATVQEKAEHTALLGALGTDRALGAFAAIARLSPSVWSRWHAFRQQRVAAVIEEWAATNRLSLTIFEPGFQAVLPTPVSVDEQRLSDLRNRLHTAIDRMPLSDLLRLSLPLEYVVDK